MAKRWQHHFLSVLKNTGNVRAACQEVGVERSTAYRARRNNHHFKKKWGEALEEAADALEAEARRRAMYGVDVPVHYRGREIGTVKRYSDGLLKILLTAARPERFGPNPGKQTDDDELTSRGAIVELVERLRREDEGGGGHQPDPQE